MDTLKPIMDTFKPKKSWFKILMNNRGEVNPPADPPADPPPADPPPTDPPANPPADPPPTDPPAANWYDGLPEDMKANPIVQKYKSNADQVKGHLELQTLINHERVALPKDENDTVAIANLNKALGVPESADGYEIQPPEPIPGMESVQFDMPEFTALAHKHNLSGKQAEGLLADYTAMLANVKSTNEAAFQADVEQTSNDLKKEWGLAYDAKVSLAQSVMNKFAGDKETFDYLNARIGTDPKALKFLANVGGQFSEGTLGDVNNPVTKFTKTPSEAKAEYDAIISNNDDIYWAGVRNKKVVSESVRRERVEYVTSLLKMAQPAGNA